MQEALYLFDILKYEDYDARGCSGGFPCVRLFVSAASEGEALTYADAALRAQTTWSYPEGAWAFADRQEFRGEAGQTFGMRYGDGLYGQEVERAKALGYLWTKTSV